MMMDEVKDGHGQLKKKKETGHPKPKSKNNQVQYTGDWASDSKLSSIHYKYWSDPYFLLMMKNKPIPCRTSLIQRGYFVRFTVCDYFIRNILRNVEDSSLNIIVLGSGLDTLYFRLYSEFGEKFKGFYEIDFDQVIKVKEKIVQEDDRLTTIAQDKLHLISGDLRNLGQIYEQLKKLNCDFNAPTIFYSECVVNYLEYFENVAILKWITTNFVNCGWFAYEQCFNEDSFGKIMVNHFEKNSFPLLGLKNNSTLKSQIIQLIESGWNSQFSLNVWDAFVNLSNENGLYPKLEGEQFDEYESLLITNLHYSVRIAFNGSLINSKAHSLINNFANQIQKESFTKTNNLNLHQNSISPISSFDNPLLKSYDSTFIITPNEVGYSQDHFNIFSIGGIGSNSQKINQIQSWKTDRMNNLLQHKSIPLISNLIKRVHAKSVYIPTHKSAYIFGGRETPNKICDNNLIRLKYDEVLKTFSIESLVNINELSCPSRWRHTFDTIELNCESYLIVFGGINNLNQVFNDFWIYNLTNSQWEEIQDLQQMVKPTARHSHSMTIDQDNKIVYIIGGFNESGGICRDSFWSFHFSHNDKDNGNYWKNHSNLVDYKYTRRVGHCSTIFTNNETNDKILIIIGGIGPNSSYSLKQFITTINIKTNATRIFDLDFGPDKLFLPFGFSAILEQDTTDRENVYLYLYGGGGPCFSFGFHLNKNGFILKIPIDC